MSASREVGIIGGGIAGCVLGMFLARRGHRVSIFEKRPRPAPGEAPPAGRSINLTLTRRGLDALEKVGAAAAAVSASAPVLHRLTHRPGGEIVQTRYSAAGHALHSIGRARLTRLLLEHWEGRFGGRVEFGARAVDPDAESGRALIEGRGVRRFDALIGADGAFSAVRRGMQRIPGFDYMQEFSAHANVELAVRPDAGWKGRGDALHVWPRRDSLLVAFPNPDGGWTLTLQLPVEGPLSPAELSRADRVPQFFSIAFPEIAPFVSDPARAVRTSPATRMVAVKCGSWAVGKSCLIGDAAHAVFPSLGQGANAALEDCLLLDEALDKTGDDFPEAFRLFYRARKPATDALCDLSREHALRLRRGVEEEDPRRARLRERLRRAWPEVGPSLYENIAFTRMPYDAALRTERALERAVDQLMPPDGLAVEAEPAVKGG